MHHGLTQMLLWLLLPSQFVANKYINACIRMNVVKITQTNERGIWRKLPGELLKTNEEHVYFLRKAKQHFLIYARLTVFNISLSAGLHMTLITQGQNTNAAFDVTNSRPHDDSVQGTTLAVRSGKNSLIK